ncbi:MAG TPA: hypothetical protein EYQ31_15730 [Candidatus Handelsmanbacteria bacterium]|nr:hypothetical protein [Candidatus Handelsmanbacteria bacterium]
MQVGTTQSQSLVASISLSSKTEATTISAEEDGSADAVLLSVGCKIDINYAQQVLETELGQSFANALRDAGIEGQILEDVFSGPWISLRRPQPNESSNSPPLSSAHRSTVSPS